MERSDKMISKVLFSEKEPVYVTGGGYPRIYKLADGSLLYGVDGFCVISHDDGLTWSDRYMYKAEYEVTNSDGETVALSCANTAFVQLEDGTVLAAYRATGHLRSDKTEFLTRIQVSQSKDGGRTWEFHSIACEYMDKEGEFKGVWEPHFGFIDGVLTCFYANDSRSVIPHPYQNLESLQWIDGKWTNRNVVADGIKHKSRDGMPVWQQLKSGKYVCAIEGWVPDTYELCIQLIWSDDGKSWSDAVTVYRGASGYAGAPYVVELPTGQLLISFQCKDALDGGEHSSVNRMLAILSDGTPVEKLTAENFTAPDNVFNTPNGKSSSWNSLYITDKYLYAATGTNAEPSGALLKRISLDELYR